MKKVLLFLFLICAANAQVLNFENLTVGAKTYHKVTITEKRPDGISIRHEAGTARINYKDVPPEVARKLGGFDPKKAEEFSKKEAEALAAQETALDAQLAKMAGTPKEKLQEAQKQIERSSLPPAEKERRRLLLIKKLDRLDLEPSRKLK